ncbi:Sodium/calcium exchanger protein-domain-containing protein [Entophlyctis helioformis]|nr:Sodium/calcium exchanger protein-domain-containing protein [Entophlyctis helioformis]
MATTTTTTTTTTYGTAVTASSATAVTLPAAHADAAQRPKHVPTLASSLKEVATRNLWFNLLLAFVPLGILAGNLGWGDTATFAINFIAIMPLAKMLDLATDELSKKVGQAIGALINASFGNAVELILGVLALRQGLLGVVQSSLLGSILSNLLFVLGFCFFLGGLFNKTQRFSAKAANTAATLLAVTILGFLLPAAFSIAIDNHRDKEGGATDPRMVAVSHATAILLLIAYVAFLVFQLVTHTHIYKSPQDQAHDAHDAESPILAAEHGHAGAHAAAEEDDEEEEELLTTAVAVGVLVVSAAIIGICAEYLVSSIEGISVQWGISETFIGLIILPIVGNAAEHITAVFASMRNKNDLAIGVALGSSMQIALFVTPVLVIAGWIMGTPLTLNFPTFDTAVLFVTILITNHLISDGESNWLEGFLLLICYLIVAVAYFYI